MWESVSVKYFGVVFVEVAMSFGLAHLSVI
jgi:hypothetical protein